LGLALYIDFGLICFPEMPLTRSNGFNWTLVRDLLLVSIWLLGLAIVNQKSQLPIYSIFPYAFAVIFVSWRHGVLMGFIVSAFATLAAFPADYLTEHPKSDLFWAAITTYVKLSVAVALTTGVKKWSAHHADE
jgi:hypothetical protein